MRVMRKHRLAERLLTDVIGLDWELVHEEACRWEHVMSETVERRLLELLDHPTESPYGNPIPGLAELGEQGDGEQFRDGVETLSSVVGDESRRVQVRRISEEMQKDESLMGALRRAGALPGPGHRGRLDPGGRAAGQLRRDCGDRPRGCRAHLRHAGLISPPIPTATRCSPPRP